MKKITTKLVAVTMALVALSSCNTWVKLIECEAVGGTKDAAKNIVSENDQIRITYDLWDRNGTLNYTVYNKTDKPLYVNWYKSAYIESGRKYNFNGAAESITFIPPKSYVTNPVSYVLLDGQSTTYFTTNKSGSKMTATNVDVRNDPNKTTEEVAKTWKKSGKIKVYSKTYDMENTPLKFRNYVTVTVCAEANECATPSSIMSFDNQFYVKKITEMTAKQFNGKGTKVKINMKRGATKTKTKAIIYSYPYKSGDSFYIPLAN
ncbi:MAG: hypothetical protein H7321_09430 [Bacteroidia bacterium]|nr:hypothetical protein [Bacteroidia bacterium]